MRRGPKPTHVEDLPDGSWLAHLRRTTPAAARREEPMLVRVIDYAIDDGRENPTAYRLLTTLLIVLFISLLSVVNYDVHCFKTVHFMSLGVLVAFGTWFVIRVDVQPPYLGYCYYGITFVFVLMIAFNTFYMKWTPPFMTLQALAEIAWAFALCACMLAFALEE